MSEMKSPLARLVLFLVALSLFGGIVAGITTSVLALSPQNSTPAAPTNCAYMDCIWNCINTVGSQGDAVLLGCTRGCSGLSLAGC